MHVARLPTYAQKEIMWKAVGYTPNPTQRAFHKAMARRLLVAGGERGGKSFSVGHEVYARLPWSPLVWLIGPDYEQARPEFGYILEDLLAVDAIESVRDVSQPRVGPWWLRARGGIEVVTKTSADVRKIASKAPYGIVLCEAAQQDYATYLKTFGRLSQHRGWLIMVGTFEGSQGYYPSLFNRWLGPNVEGGKSFSLPTWSNTTSYPGGRQDPEILGIEAVTPPDMFQERYGAIPCKPEGLVFKAFDHTTHVQALTIAPDLPVELAIDPGYASAYAILAIQSAGPFVHVIDEIYGRGKTAQELIAECKQKPWWGQVPKASQGKSGGTIDVAGTQHQGLPSHVEIWAQEADVSLRYAAVGIEDGINVVRVRLAHPTTGEPSLFFADTLRSDKDLTGHPRGILGELGLYQYPKSTDGKPITEKPIDAYNHSIKALGYWLYDRFGPAGGRTSSAGQTRRKGFGTR
ncbi:MAG: hypothetical protein KAZ26_24465 [Caldilineaceae bacterium]|nr:hypothetical protein [Caldilineaceae bacterium]